MPGIADADAITRLQIRCIREFRAVAEVDGARPGFTVTAQKLDREMLRDRVVGVVRAEFMREAKLDWPPPEQWFDLS